MNEIAFLVQEAEEGGDATRRGRWANPFFTEGETMEELKASIKEAVQCCFGEDSINDCRADYRS